MGTQALWEWGELWFLFLAFFSPRQHILCGAMTEWGAGDSVGEMHALCCSTFWLEERNAEKQTHSSNVFSMLVYVGSRGKGRRAARLSLCNCDCRAPGKYWHQISWQMCCSGVAGGSLPLVQPPLLVEAVAPTPRCCVSQQLVCCCMMCCRDGAPCCVCSVGRAWFCMHGMHVSLLFAPQDGHYLPISFINKNQLLAAGRENRNILFSISNWLPGLWTTAGVLCWAW